MKSGDVEKKKDVIVGIDLGTTNSLVAYMLDGSPVAVKDESQNHTLVPSVLHFGSDGTITVGDAARNKLIEDPEHTLYSVKRLMGKSFKDIGEQGKFLGYIMVPADDDSLVKINIYDKYYTPVELSAEILRELKTRIEHTLKQPVTKAVITVPAYFNDTQRQATRDAGRLAGLDILRVINEPTAASLAYGLGKDKESSENIAVYDLGGGTFDISILHLEDGIFDVLSTHGDTQLGGDDFDLAIVHHWLDTMITGKARFENDKSMMQLLRKTAEDAKKHLTSSSVFEATIENEKLTIDRDTFESLIQPLVARTVASCKKAMADAGLKNTDIDHVVMVGGSTRVPYVKQSIAGFFGKEVNDSLNPDEVVALGAAVQADILGENTNNFLLLDVTPLSLGIETMGGLMDVIIPRNSKIPLRAGRQYTTSIDGQKNLKISVYQGERDLVEFNRKLGEFILKGIPPMGAGLPKIEIVFSINADGILSVKAKELRSGTAQEIEIRNTYAIPEEKMAEMLLDSIKNAQQDVASKGRLEAINEANYILNATDKFVTQNRAWLSTTEIDEISARKAGLSQAVNDQDKDAINKAIDLLNAYTAPLAEKAMDIHIAEALRGKKIE